MKTPLSSKIRGLSRKARYRPLAERMAEDRRTALLSDTGPRHGRRSLLRRAGALLMAPQWLASAGLIAIHATQRPATAAQIRHFPDNTQVGRIRFGHFPEATLNGKPIRLGQGVRILSQDNIIVTPASVFGRSYVVGYKVGALDEIVTVWILSKDEYQALRKQQKQS